MGKEAEEAFERLNGAPRLYQEEEDAGNSYRQRQHDELEDLILGLRRQSREKRRAYFSPDFTDIGSYARSIERYRQDFAGMLGMPLSAQEPVSAETETAAEYIPVAEDELGEIFRVILPVREGLNTYGLFFRPSGEGPFPLVISQHGGQGTPELTAGFFGSDNYNDMTRRILRRGAAVFAPQLLLWEAERFGPKHDRRKMDIQLKQLGGSITAVEVYKLQRSLDRLLRRPDIDENRVGMVGLSYGGFYTLFAAAADTRIRVVVSSCFVNDRYAYDWSDWTWFNAGNTFLDAEICGLICPRPLYVEAGIRDELFAVGGFRKTSESARTYFERLGLEDRFEAAVFDGAHEFNPGDQPINFLFKHL
ncbi:alpha/beta hydrolase family protein [Cohnella hashimotonis]|uniref:Prolyl oligopeptidase family serine peptidase n=1 Tax=Cohnella hashimotonis TaxID=2826895 RepID=A0ABT6TLP8_9BACL|nr:prolyl oligopeptidase family serine peptidase [Cohnella hashimotonis]MDI4647777.1 prolyl oligopeptidase family serine peptidase [Cohnella hashimotonis]